MKLLHLCMLMFFMAVGEAAGQTEAERDREIERIADELFALQDLDLDYSELYENLLQLRSDPIDINSASGEQLRSLFILSESQINAILDYRAQAGPLLSVYELQNVEGLDASVLSRLALFVTVNANARQDKNFLSRIGSPGHGYIILRHQRTIELKKGYRVIGGQPAAYAGSPDNLYLRLRTSRANDYSIGLTAEKDPGEAIDWDASKGIYGMDYYSYHFQLINKGRVKNLIAGDYQAQFGQGLLLGGAFGVGKGAETIITTRRNNLGFLPYTSLNENNFFRGLAITYQLASHWQASGFLSYKKGDGSGQLDSVGNILGVSSLSQSGLHRTASELSNRKSIAESNTGFVLGYEKNSLSSGIVLNYMHFDTPINASVTPYNQFYFRGSASFNTSAYLNFSWRNLSFFSEAARSNGHAGAGIVGLLASVSHAMDLSLVYRSFAPDFHSYHGNAFAERSTPQNESGFYMGWKYRITKQHLFAGYTDLFQFKWLQYRIYSPSHGHEWLARYTFTPSKGLSFYIQIREEDKARNLAETTIYQTTQGRKRNYWLNLDYDVSNQLSFRTRIQQSTYSFAEQTTRGFAVIQDATWSIKRMSLSARYALFDTDDYDNRQYVYERDVWLAYSIPAYYGVGVRSYLLMRFRFTSHLDAWLRWARTTLLNQETIGSGNETIEGNQRNDIKFQLRFKF